MNLLDPLSALQTESDLAGLAVALGAGEVGRLSQPEASLASAATTVDRRIAKLVRDMIGDRLDPLGDTFGHLRSPEERRPLGATYTPPAIVDSMVAWAASQGSPDRVIDPGAGSGRFSLAAARAFPRAELVAVEIDPLAALCARANLAVAGLASRSQVVLDDFRALPPQSSGSTLWLGNPPYVRHHQLGRDWKEWLAQEARRRGLPASKLAGLHVHFFLAAACQARPGDIGCFVTASEWLDVNYGSLVRDLLLDGLGGTAVHMLEPEAFPFADAATTGAITCFRVGTRPTSLRLRRIKAVRDLEDLSGGRPVRRDRLQQAPRWTPLMRSSMPVPEGYVELGELCRVHRGTVTGANRVWVGGAAIHPLPERVKYPAVTRAQELFRAGTAIADDLGLRRVVDLPSDLDALDGDERKLVEKFIKWARGQGAHLGYIATHRKQWYSIGMREPAPILATYMARRPPAFVRNLVNARHINIAHGLYPRQPLDDGALDRLATSLRSVVSRSQGRTYAGGLTKFEPREMERIPIPHPDHLLV